MRLLATFVVCSCIAACSSSDSFTPAPPPPPTPPSASLSATAIDFGLADCGGAVPAPQALKISNTGDEDLSYSVSLDDTATFAISGASGTINGGASATVAITAKAVPAALQAGTVLHASLLVTTSDTAHAALFVPLTMTAQGASFVVTPAEAAFGQIPIGAQAPDIPLSIKNVGNKAAAVAIAPPADLDFSVSWVDAPKPAPVVPGASLAGAAARFKPSANKKLVSSAAFAITGAVCGAPVADLKLDGEGTNGVVGVSPESLDFGLVDCGKQGAAQVVTILNTGNAAFDYTAALGAGASSPYAISPASATVLAGSQVQILVAPKPIPAVSAITPDLYGDKLTITTDAKGDGAHEVDLAETAHGAILATGAATVAFGNQQVGTAPTQLLSFTNTGNATAVLALSTTGPFSAPGTVTVPAMGASASLGFSPPATSLGKAVSASLSYTTGDPLCAPLPAPVALSGTPFDIAASVTAGGDHTCALGTTGTSYCWGNNGNGELGNGTFTNADGPGPVESLAPAISGLCAGYSHSCALRKDGTVSCWGADFSGQLGDGANSSEPLPVDVSKLTDAAAVAGGGAFTCALGAGGAVSCWGANFSGQLGNGTTTSANMPVAVSGLADATAIALGGSHACARRATGNVVCWGANFSGQLGNGTTTSSSTPVAVSGLADAVAIAAGEDHSCAVRATGNVVCWGANFFGQLGDGTTTGSTTPVTATGIIDAAAVTEGAFHTCALRKTGAIDCWGYNAFGQLGDGSTKDSTAPTAVTGVTTAQAVGAGFEHSCAALADGSLVCWGYDYYGQLGDSKIGGQSTVPVPVTGF